MVDIANDIQQLKALKSDLKKRESLTKKVEELKKETNNIKAQITSISVPKFPLKSEQKAVEEEINREVLKRKEESKIGKITNVLVFLMIVPPIIAIIVSFFVGHIFITVLLSVVWFFINAIILGSLPDETNKITAEVRLQYQTKFDDIEARKKAYDLDRQHRIESAIANDPDLKQCYQELEQCKTDLDLCKANIYNNNILSGQDKNLDTVSYVLDQLISKRADSIKEALQRYDDKRARDSQFAFDQWQRAFDREVARQEAEKREAEARRERELQRIRQEKIDRENKELRDKISNSLDDIEDIKRSLDK